MKKYRYLPSSAAFQWSSMTISPKSSGCLRNILFANHGLRDELPPEYNEMGKRYEEIHDARLKQQYPEATIVREEPIKESIYGSELVDYSGRMDFLIVHGDGRRELHECKATASKNVRREVIRKGIVSPNHLAQLVSYMAHVEIHQATLCVGYVEREADRYELKEERLFIITIDDEGKILVDGIPSGYRVQDQLAHMQQARVTLEQQKLPDRPEGYQAKWSSPCTFCPFKAACDKLDNMAPQEAEEKKIELARESLEEHKRMKQEKKNESTS